MRYKGLAFCFALLALVLMRTTDAFAVETHQGKVLAVGANRLTIMEAMSNKQLTHEVATNADIICEKKKCELSDVQAGALVTVIVDQAGDKTLITKVEVKNAGSPS
jgi:hypothetical protein